MQRQTGFWLLIASVLLVLSGCGNKGPLYLPPEPVEQTGQESPESES